MSATLDVAPDNDTFSSDVTRSYTISTNSDGVTSPVASSGWVSGTYAIPSGTLVDGTTYYWKVQVKGTPQGSSTVTTVTSPVWSFKASQSLSSLETDTPAAGTPPSDYSATPASSTATAADTSSETDPSTNSLIKQINSSGGIILGLSDTNYTDVGPVKTGGPTSHATPAATVGPCGLHVIIYKSGNRIYSSSLTSCSATFTISYMDSQIDKYDTFWGIWAKTKSHDVSKEYLTGYTNTYYYSCASKNKSGFRTETYGGVVFDGEEWHAEAYDALSTKNLTACG